MIPLNQMNLKMISPFDWTEIGKESKDYKIVIGTYEEDDPYPCYLLVNKKYGIVEASFSILPNALSTMYQCQCYLDTFEKEEGNKVKTLLKLINTEPEEN